MMGQGGVGKGRSMHVYVHACALEDLLYMHANECVSMRP